MGFLEILNVLSITKDSILLVVNLTNISKLKTTFPNRFSVNSADKY